MLEINDLKKTFDNGTPALKGINLKVNKGEFVSILGPSGSGKTTLLRSINGLETSSGGEIYFDNKIVNKNTILDVQKKTGMIFQEFNLVNNLSAINNVLTGLLNSSNKFLSLFYLFKKDQKIKALKALETVGLLEKSYNRSDELSGGQRQRVGIARAIIKQPLLLLADEPVASLDPKAANVILSLLKKINKDFGTTILCNLHQVDLAKKYSLTGIIATNTTIIKEKGEGGISGKLCLEKSRNVRRWILEEARECPNLDVIGVGGISSFKDLWDFWQDGGKAVQIYTAFIYQGPAILDQIKEGIDGVLALNGLKTVGELIENLDKIKSPFPK